MPKRTPTNPTNIKKTGGYKGEAWEDAFLKAFASSGSVTLAAKVAGIDRSTAYQWKKDRPDFAAKFELAKEQTIGTLEGVAMQMAIVEHNPTMVIFLLKNLKPDVYGDRVKQDVDGEITIRVVRGDGNHSA